MKLSDWLDQEEGRTTAMAAHFGITKSAVSQWRLQVPPGRMREVRDFTGGAVAFDDMLPGGAPAVDPDRPSVNEAAHAPGVNDRRRDRREVIRRKKERRGPDRREVERSKKAGQTEGGEG